MSVLGRHTDSPENTSLFPNIGLLQAAGVGSAFNESQQDSSDHLLRAINERKATLLLPATLVTVTLLLMGLVGNPLAIYIYGWRWQASSTKVFLFSLAVIDLLNCLITIPTEIAIMTNYYTFHSDGLCKVSRFITYLMNNATSAIFLAISVDRYIRICHPHRKTVSARCAKVACAIGLLIGLTVSWPALFLYGKIPLSVPVKLDADAGHVFVTASMCLVHRDMAHYSLAFFVYLCSAFFVCVLILVVLYTLIGRTILERNRKSRMRKQATATALENMGAGCVNVGGGGGGGGGGSNGNALGSQGLRVQSSSTAADRSPMPSPRLNHESGAASSRAMSQDLLTRGPDPDQESLRGCNVQNLSTRCKKLRPPKATLMLFLITVVFITSFLPFLIISIIRQHMGPSFYLGLSPRKEVAVNIFIRSYVVNNCTNPIVYGLCNKQFRRECHRLYVRLFRPRGGTGSDYYASGRGAPSGPSGAAAPSSVYVNGGGVGGGGVGGGGVAENSPRQFSPRDEVYNRSRTLYEDDTPRLVRKVNPET